MEILSGASLVPKQMASAIFVAVANTRLRALTGARVLCATVTVIVTCIRHDSRQVFTMSLAGTKLVVGTSGLHIPIWDLRHMDAPVEKRVSSLKYQTRAIRCFPDKTGYALGSVEGRVAIE